MLSSRLPFNPSLVRLARRRPRCESGASLSFQSQLGSIGARPMTIRPPRKPSLSIPAWFDWRVSFDAELGEDFSLSIPAWFDWRSCHISRPSHAASCFQSQLGSIGAARMMRATWERDMLSIPAWFDWRNSFASSSVGVCRLSIPAWFDWRMARRQHEGQRAVRLSIPAWFDWRLSMLRPAGTQPSTFNPSLVRLALALPRLPPPPEAPFNPSLVRLALGSSGRSLSRSRPFNPSLVRLALR